MKNHFKPKFFWACFWAVSDLGLAAVAVLYFSKRTTTVELPFFEQVGFDCFFGLEFALSASCVIIRHYSSKDVTFRRYPSKFVT